MAKASGLRDGQGLNRSPVDLAVRADWNLVEGDEEGQGNIYGRRQQEPQLPKQCPLPAFIAIVLARRELYMSHQDIPAAHRDDSFKQSFFGGRPDARLDISQADADAANLGLRVAGNAALEPERQGFVKVSQVAGLVDDAVAPRVADELATAQFLVVEGATRDTGPADQDLACDAMGNKLQVAVDDLHCILGQREPGRNIPFVIHKLEGGVDSNHNKSIRSNATLIRAHVEPRIKCAHVIVYDDLLNIIFIRRFGQLASDRGVIHIIGYVSLLALIVRNHWKRGLRNQSGASSRKPSISLLRRPAVISRLVLESERPAAINLGQKSIGIPFANGSVTYVLEAIEHSMVAVC